MNLKQIEKLSPVEIRYANIDPDAGRFYLRVPCIKINKNNNGIVQAAALLHEIGHAVCYANNCVCFKKSPRDGVLREYHAYKFQLKHSKNDKILIDQFIKNINYVNDNQIYPDHSKAAKRIMALKSWHKLLKIEQYRGTI